jgi:putative hydrolase of the HAD superfamily
MPIDALFFDLDDTLSDETGSVTVALEATGRFVAGRLGLSDWERVAEVYMRVSDVLWADFDSWGRGLNRLDARRYVWRAVLVDGGYPCDDALVESVAACYNEHRNRQYSWLPQARETLLALRGSYKLGLITNGSTDMQRAKIRYLELEGLFDMTLVAEECGYSKPRPEVFQRAMEGLGVSADQSVMIGNSVEADVLGGYGVGMRTVWVCADGRPWPIPIAAPWRTVRSVAELPAVLEDAEDESLLAS